MNGLIFSGDNLVDIQLVTFLLLSIISEIKIGPKTEKFWWPSSPVKYILLNKKLYCFVDNTLTFYGRLFISFSTSTCFRLFKITIFINTF